MIVNANDESRLSEANLALRKGMEVAFFGSVSFGFFDNDQPIIISTLSFCRISILPDKKLPFNLSDISWIDPKKPIEVGYLGKGLQVRETDCISSNDFQSKARPYISGLTREVLETAFEIRNNWKIYSGPLRRIIADYPFNTMSFYTNFSESQPPEEYYRTIVEGDFFENYGGNCTLFSLAIAKEFQKTGKDVRIALFPVTYEGGDELVGGHSAVVVDLDSSLSFLLDPGLSIPYPLPFSDKIPLFYEFGYGDGKVVSLHAIPNLSFLISKNKNRSVNFPCQGICNLKEFKSLASYILSDLHHLRNEDQRKVDFHSSDGRRILRISTNSSDGSESSLSDKAREILRYLLSDH